MAGSKRQQRDPIPESEAEFEVDLSRVRDLVHAGEASWSGGKPKGSARPVKIRGKSLSDMVVEDRR